MQRGMRGLVIVLDVREQISAQFIKGMEIFATMSSDEFKKDKHYPKKNFFYGICLFCFR